MSEYPKIRVTDAPGYADFVGELILDSEHFVTNVVVAFMTEGAQELAVVPRKCVTRLPENYGTIWVCQDCMLHHANGECGSCNGLYGPHDEEPLSAIGDGFHVAMGMAPDEHECNDDENGIDYGECDCETDTFSTSQCDGCGSWLHGERHAMTLFKD